MAMRAPGTANGKKPSTPPGLSTPERFGSHTTPKIINLPTTTWINPPLQEEAA